MVSSFQGNVIIFCQAGIIWANHHDLVEAGFQALNLSILSFPLFLNRVFTRREQLSGVQKPEVFISLLSMLLCLEFHLLSPHHFKSASVVSLQLFSLPVLLCVWCLVSCLCLRGLSVNILMKTACKKFLFFYAFLSFQTLAS